MFIRCNSVKRSHVVLFTKSERQMLLQDANMVAVHENELKVIVHELHKLSFTLRRHHHCHICHHN